MRVTKRLLGIGALLVVLVLSGAGVYMRISDHAEAAENAESEGDASDLPANSAADAFSTDLAVAVEGAPVIRDTLVMTVRAEGEATSWQQTAIRSQVSGQVQAVHVIENRAVAENAVLIEIDPTEYELALEEAQARLRQAEVSYRETTLDDHRIEDPRVRAERDSAARARSGLDAAGIAVERAELNLARTRIAAPFAGRIANLKVVPGQHVNAGDEVLTVQAMDPIRIDAHVTEQYVRYLAVGRTARITFTAFPDMVFEGRIERINPIVDSQSRMARVSVSVPNRDGRILPGMYASATLPAERFPNRVLVPKEAVLERDTDRRTLVFVFKGEGDTGRAQWHYVTTGMRNDEFIEIVDDPEKEPLEPGWIVLVAGHNTLSHDIPVRLVDNVSRAEGARPQ